MLRLSPSRSRNYPYHTILTKSTLKMLHFSVHLSSDLSRALPPGLANPAAASLAAAGGVQRAVQENFLRRGGKSFWPQAAELTKVSPAGADGAQVSVYRRGVALRLLGGRVQAKPGHAMALPVKRGDSDLWPREIPGLSLVRWRSGGKVRALANTTRPAQELYRAWPAKQERDWPTRWKDAADAVGWEGVATNGQMIALKTSPIWVAISRFGQPYPPFDYGSHMRVRSVPLEVAQAAGLLTSEEERQSTRDAMETESRRSLNEGVEVGVQGLSYDLLKELDKQLQGLAVLDHGVLRMTDPNGTKPYWPEELASILSAPLPNGIPNLQIDAVRAWLEDSSRFNPLSAEEKRALEKWRKEQGDKPWGGKVSLDVKENFARVMDRTKSKESTQMLIRGMGFGSMEDYNSFLRDITNKDYYQALKGHVADSWTTSDAIAEAYASKKKWQVKLICTHHKSAKDLRPLYAIARPQSSTPTKPLATEAELLIPGNVRMRVLDYESKDVGGGKRLTIYCEEE